MTDMMVMANAILPFILMAAIFYFMLWRPQKQEQKKRKEMLDSLKRGDKIITIGGMYGTLTKVGPTKVKIRLAEGIEIDFARTAVSCLQDAGLILPEQRSAVYRMPARISSPKIWKPDEAVTVKRRKA